MEGQSSLKGPPEAHGCRGSTCPFMTAVGRNAQELGSCVSVCRLGASLFHIPHSGKLTHDFLMVESEMETCDVSEHIGSHQSQCHFHSHSIV